MLNNNKLTLLCFIVVMFDYIQTQNCLCERSGSGSSWAQNAEKVIGPCSGICDLATQNRTRICKLPGNKHTLCNIVQQCTVRATCEGKWSKWSNTGPCSSSCGSGVRLQSRTCYKRGTGPSKSRSKYCLGGKGLVEERRQSNCKRKRCPTPKTTTINIFSRFTNRIVATTLPPISNNSTYLPPNDVTTATKDSNSSPAPSLHINLLTLGTILASVIIISIALIIITILCLRNKKTRHSESFSMGTISASAIKKKQEDENYESIPPELPPMRTRHDNGTIQSQNSNVVVKNRLYRPASESGSMSTIPPPPYEGIYLDPDPLVNSLERGRYEAEDDDMYITIDDVHK